MARITVEDCLKETGHENRFSLIHLALERVKQHRDGHPVILEGENREGAPVELKGNNKEVVMTLREIAAGFVSAENIHDFTNTQLEEEIGEEESDTEEEEVESSS